MGLKPCKLSGLLSPWGFSPAGNHIMTARTIDILKAPEPLHADETLVRSCVAGDLRSQRQLYDQYKRSMFRLCLRYADSREDAEDYLQEGFVRVFRDLHQFRMEGELGGWIRKVVLNVVLQQLRKKKRLFVSTEIEKVQHTIAIEHDYNGNIDAKFLTRVIQQLPAGYRTVFNMYVVDGYTHREIAGELDISVGTSKSQLSKAKAMLREQLGSIYEREKV